MPPLYHPSVPREAPQMYFVQGAPGFFPHQSANNFFQQHPIREFRHGIPPNYMIPFHLRRQQVGPMGFRRGGPIPPQQILGGELYPLVEAIKQEHAIKVTGMLLETDQI